MSGSRPAVGVSKEDTVSSSVGEIADTSGGEVVGVVTSVGDGDVVSVDNAVTV